MAKNFKLYFSAFAWFLIVFKKVTKVVINYILLFCEVKMMIWSRAMFKMVSVRLKAAKNQLTIAIDFSLAPEAFPLTKMMLSN